MTVSASWWEAFIFPGKAVGSFIPGTLSLSVLFFFSLPPFFSPFSFKSELLASWHPGTSFGDQGERAGAVAVSESRLAPSQAFYHHGRGRRLGRRQLCLRPAFLFVLKKKEPLALKTQEFGFPRMNPAPF